MNIELIDLYDSDDSDILELNEAGANGEVDRSLEEVQSDSDDSVVCVLNDAKGKEEINRSSTEVHQLASDEAAETSYSQEAVLVKTWSSLPSPCVSSIYSFLSRNDQCCMSLACRSWSEEYGSPSLWKTFRFFLPEHEYNSSVYPEVKFARKYGTMFRNVEVVCKKVRNQMLVPIEQQLLLFLQSLETGAQLKSIKFSNLHNYLRNVEDAVREDIVRGMEAFFRSQNNLRDVEFHDCLFLTHESAKLIAAIFHKSENTVQNLTLKRFVLNPRAIDLSNASISRSPEVCDKFLDLQSLNSDYTQFIEDVLRCLYSTHLSSPDSTTSNKKRNLSLLKLMCDGSKRQYFQGIPACAWRYLKTVCPDLEVDFEFIASPRGAETEFFLTKHMPIRSLDFRLERRQAATRTPINHLFVHLVGSRISSSLVSLKVFWGYSAPDFAGELLPFLQQCPKLQFLQITVHYPVGGIEDVFKSFQDQRPASLTCFHLTVDSVGSEADYNDLLALNENYYPIMKDLKLEMILIAEQGWRPRRSHS